jgi:hypothetical protein
LAEEIKPKYKQGPIRIDWERYYKHSPHLAREHVSICEYIGMSKEGFEKYIDFQTKVTSEETWKKRVWGKGLQDPEKIKESWLKRERVTFLSDDQIYHYNPEFWDQWIMPGTKKEG